MNIRVIYCYLFILAGWLVSACGGHRSGDTVLESFGKHAIVLTPTEIIDLESYGFEMPAEPTVVGDWVALSEAVSIERHISLLNYRTGEHFPLLLHGRGPGELQNPSFRTVRDSCLILIDQSSRVAVSVPIRLSAEAGRAVMDTIARFDTAVPYVSRYVPAVGGQFITTLFSPTDPCWYALRDSLGNVVSTIPPPAFPVLEKMSPSLLGSFLGSSSIVTNPEGDRVCVAMAPACVLSFSSIEGNSLKEYYRLEACPPPIVGQGDGSSYAADLRTYFGVSCADGQYIYYLYANKDGFAEIPGYECEHLLVFDWQGNPCCHYELIYPASGICMYGGKLYCTTTYPESRLYIYDGVLQ